MIQPRQYFLFFLVDYAGRAYYLDGQGNVQLGNINGPDYSLDSSPANWRDIEISWGRNTHYWGLIRSFSSDIKFTGNGATIIRNLLYLGQGITQQVYFTATKWNPNTGNYELYYQGELDFTTITEDDPLTGITLKTLEGGLPKLIKTYEKIIHEIPLDGSIAQNQQGLINGIMFQADVYYSLLPISSGWDTGNGLAIVYEMIVGNDVGIETQSQKFISFTASNPSTVANVLAQGNYIFASVNALDPLNTTGANNILGGLAISITIQLAGSITNGQFWAYFIDGSSPVALTTLQNFTTGSYNFTANIAVPAGSGVMIMLNMTAQTGAEIISGTIQLTFNSQYQDTYCYLIEPYDLFNLIMQKIYTLASASVGHNLSYNATSNILQSISNLMVTSGMSLRGLPNAVLKISLSDFFDIYNPELLAAMGTEIVSDGNGNYFSQLFFEGRLSVLNSNNIDLNLGEVSHLKIVPTEDLMVSDIKAGYKEQKYDNKQGNDEINTTAQYKTPFDKTKRTLDLISTARGDSFGVEYTRFLTGTTNTSNNKSDNEFFLLNMNLQGSSIADAIVTAIVTQILPTQIYFNNKVFQVTTVRPLNWPIQWGNIQGTGWAGNLSLQPGIFQPISSNLSEVIDNSLITYTNEAGSSKVSGNINVSGVINSMFYVDYDENLQDTSALGSINVMFSLMGSGVVIAQQSIFITFGIEFNLQFKFSTTLFAGNSLYLIWQIEGGVLEFDYYTMNINGNKTVILPNGLIGYFNSCTINFSNTDLPIYGLYRAKYDSINAGNMINPAWSYNIEQMTPSRIVKANGPWIVSLFYSMVNKFLKFQTSDKNHVLSTTINNTTFEEGVDLLISDLAITPMFYPFYLIFDTQIPWTFVQLMNATRNAHIMFTFYGIPFYGFPIDTKVKPGLNESQTWKMLASPANNLSNFVNFNFNGLNLLNLNKMGTFISFLNPIKMYPCSTNNDARFNFRHMDTDFFINQVSFYSQKEDYYQPWQTDDTICMQVLTNGIGPVVAVVYNDLQQIIGSYNLTGKTATGVNPPNLIWELELACSTLGIGTYYLLINSGVNGAMDSFISEPFQIAVTQEITMLFQYTNTIDKLDMFFSTGFSPSWRVEAWMDNFLPKDHTSMFEDQPADVKIQNSIPYRSHKLNIGNKRGLPPYMADIAARIMGMDTVLIDNIQFAKFADDSEWENIQPQGWPKGYYSLQVREAQSLPGVQANTSGSIQNELITNIFVNTLGFGESNTADNVVPVQKIE